MAGCVHVYTGDGKGKTTAAFGLALRAVGHGFQVYIAQFMKARPTGEVHALLENPLVKIDRSGSGFCLRRENVTDEHIREAQSVFFRCRDALASGQYRLFILDEINVAVGYGLVSVEQVLELMATRPDGTDLVLTGRRAAPEVVAAADLVSEIRCVKHYYERGVAAREGVEF
jgi:cob(I)alamin adenosyltransferase